jgi:Sucrase/ferredoxin-like
VIISTGISNWAHEVTETEGSLAYFLSKALSKKNKEAKPPRGPDVPNLPEDQLSAAVAAIQLESTPTSVPPPQAGKDSETQEKKEEKKDTFPAILDTSQSKRLIINNGSFKSASDSDDCLTAVVLPDFTYVNEIKETKENAERLWSTTLDPSVRRAGRKLPDVETASQNKFQTRPLPYDSVVLICECVLGFLCPLRTHVACVGSHKRRDNRCGIAAPILEKGAIMLILFAKEEI